MVINQSIPFHAVAGLEKKQLQGLSIYNRVTNQSKFIISRTLKHGWYLKQQIKVMEPYFLKQSPVHILLFTQNSTYMD